MSKDPPGNPAADGLPAGRRGLALAGTTLAVIITVLDIAMVTIALPAMARSFDVAPAAAIWIVMSFQLAVTAALFPMAALGDRLGHERVYCGGILLFTLGALACALAPTLVTLCLARAVQGLGSAAVMSVNLALIRAILPQAGFGRGVAHNTLVVALSSTAGPIVGAMILSSATWPWLFLVNVPCGLLAASVCLKVLPRTQRQGRPFDVAGALLNAPAVGLLLLGISGLGRSQALWLSVLELSAAGVLILALVRHQLRHAVPMVPLDLVRIEAVGLAAATSTCSYVVQGLGFAALPFLLCDTFGLSQLDAGWAMMAWPGGVALAAMVAGRLADRFPAARLNAVALAVLTLGLVALLALPPAPQLPDIAWRMALCGFGFGLFQVPNSRAILAESPPERRAGASALQSAARLLGQSLGAAMAGAIFGMASGAAAWLAIGIAVGVAAFACILSLARVWATRGAGGVLRHPGRRPDDRPSRSPQRRSG